MNKSGLDKCTSFIYRNAKDNVENDYVPQKELLEETMNATKSIRTNYLDTKIENFERKLHEFENNFQKTFKKMTEKLEEIKETVSGENEKNESYANEQFSKFFKKREDQINQVERELALKRTQENAVIKILEQEVVFMKSENQKETSDRTRSLNELKKEFESEIGNLNENVKKEGLAAGAALQEITSKFSNDLQVASQSLNVEINNRVDLGKAVMDMKSDILNRTKNELEVVSKSRVQSQNDIQKMLEIAFNKVNQGI